MKVMRAVESHLKPGFYRLFHGSKPLIYDTKMAVYSPAQVMRLAKTYHFDRIYWAETIIENSWSQSVCDSKNGNTSVTATSSTADTGSTPKPSSTDTPTTLK